MSLRAPRRLVAAAAVPALMAGVVVAAPANAAPAADEPKYKGSAFALQARVALGGETLLDLMLPDIVTFPSGGDKNLLGLPAELKDVATLKVLNASAGVKDGKFAANSSTAGLSVLGDLVGALVLNSDCGADQLRLTGDSSVAGISLLGTKVPVDPGPNFRIDIPKELELLLKGSIVIDEQNKLDDGGLQIRALHINLVVAPDALGAALKSALASVRAVAEQLVTTVETATGQSLDELLAKTQGVKPVVGGGAQSDRSVRAKSDAARVQKTQKAEKVTKAEKAKVASSATSAKEASVATEQTQTEAATEQAAPAQDTSVTKADQAEVNRQAAADQAAAEQAMAQRAERGAKPTAPQAGTAEQEAADAAAAERAEASTTQGSTEQAEAAQQTQATEAERAAQADAAIAAEREAKVEQKATADDTAEKARAQRTATMKSDRADLGTPDRTAVRAAAPAAEDDDDDINGLIGLDVIVSEVNCVGAKFRKHDVPKRILPKTGGNGDMAQRHGRHRPGPAARRFRRGVHHPPSAPPQLATPERAAPRLSVPPVMLCGLIRRDRNGEARVG